MRKSHKPGAKIHTEQPAKYKNYDLGDTDTTDADDTGSENGFCSPEQNDGDTDYGLEITSGGGGGGGVGAAASMRKSPRRTPKQHQQQQQTTTPAVAFSTPVTQITKNAKQPPIQTQRRKQMLPTSRTQQNLRYVREVEKLQARTDFLIPRLPFSRLVRELIFSFHDREHGVSRITMEALTALQTAAEIYLTQRLQDAYFLTLHRQRVTLNLNDMELIKFFRNT